MSEAWNDINPPMASARQPEPRSQSSDQTEARKVFRNELTACLTLTAPVGMSEEAKRDWFAVAWDTLKGIPEDLLKRGCLHARRHADHPSKIVPLIIGEIETDWERRKRFHREWSHDQQQLAAPTYAPIPHEETQRILREAFGDLAEDQAG